MDVDNLINMANKIGIFFESYPDQEEASNEIASHLKKFWAPRMRIALLDYLDKQGGEELIPIVLASVNKHRAMLEPVVTPLP
jgi:formate dehydrogenase subunit delta